MAEHVSDPAPDPAPAPAPARASSPATAAAPARKTEDRFPRGLVIRLFVYLVAGHLFAGFLWLIFELGASRR